MADDGLLEAVRGLHLAHPELGPKPLLAKLRAQQPDLAAGNKEVREALAALKAEESKPTEAAAAAPPAAAPPVAAAACAAASSRERWSRLASVAQNGVRDPSGVQLRYMCAAATTRRIRRSVSTPSADGTNICCC